jgi:hypothetical protein
MFTASSVNGFLSKFPDDYVFAEDKVTGDYIDYINDLPPIPRHPDE